MKNAKNWNKKIYLDDNASSPLRPQARDAILEALCVTGNPSSVHGYGRQARRLLEQARETIARGVNALPEEIIFTSGGTEANGLALGGMASHLAQQTPTQAPQICITAVEHDAVARAVDQPLIVGVDAFGGVDRDALSRLLGTLDHPFLCSMIWAHNETGVVNDLPTLAPLIKERGGWVHTDACQMMGRLPLDFDASGVDMMSLSSHKMGGPCGIGALVVRRQVPLTPMMRGGGQERGMRSGTPSVPLICGFAAAVQEAAETVAQDRERHRLWQERLETLLLETGPGVSIIGHGACRLPQTVCVTMPGVLSHVQVMNLDMGGIAVSAGSACSSGKVSLSPRLKAMGIPDAVAQTTLRVSWGWHTQETEVEAFAQAWKALYERLATPRAKGRSMGHSERFEDRPVEQLVEQRKAVTP